MKRRAQALRLISLAGSRSGLVGLLTVTHPLPSDTLGGRVGLCRGQRPSFQGRCAGGWGDVTHYLAVLGRSNRALRPLMSGVGSRETGLDSFRLETGWSRVRALPRPISQVGWSAETTLSICLSIKD